MLGSGMNLITTVIGFGMSITFIVFICTRLLCGRMGSAEARAAAASTAPTAYDLELQSEPDQPEHVVDGMEPVAVASLPTTKYKNTASLTSEDAQCSICLGDYQEKEILRIMPICGHVFHLICVDAWLQKQSTCPICRLSLHDLMGAKSTSPFSRGVQTLDISQVASHSFSQLLNPDHENSNILENDHEIHETLQFNLNDTRTEATEGMR